MNRTEQCLEKYGVLECGQPVLCSHIFKNFVKSVRDITKWASSENAKNGLPEITFSSVMNLRRIYRTRHNGRNFLKFKKSCKKLSHPGTSERASIETPTTPIETLFLIIEKNWKWQYLNKEKYFLCWNGRSKN